MCKSIIIILICSLFCSPAYSSLGACAEELNQEFNSSVELDFFANASGDDVVSLFAGSGISESIIAAQIGGEVTAIDLKEPKEKLTGVNYLTGYIVRPRENLKVAYEPNAIHEYYKYLKPDPIVQKLELINAKLLNSFSHVLMINPDVDHSFSHVANLEGKKLYDEINPIIQSFLKQSEFSRKKSPAFAGEVTYGTDDLSVYEILKNASDTTNKNPKFFSKLNMRGRAVVETINRAIPFLREGGKIYLLTEIIDSLSFNYNEDIHQFGGKNFRFLIKSPLVEDINIRNLKNAFPGLQITKSPAGLKEILWPKEVDLRNPFGRSAVTAWEISFN